jgi:hypothetical protein
MVNFGDETTLNSDEGDATIRMEEDRVSSNDNSFNQNNRMDTSIWSSHSSTWGHKSTEQFNHK